MRFILFSRKVIQQEVEAKTPLGLFDAVLNMKGFEYFWALDVVVHSEKHRTVLFSASSQAGPDFNGVIFHETHKDDLEYLEGKIVEAWENAVVQCRRKRRAKR